MFEDMYEEIETYVKSKGEYLTLMDLNFSKENKYSRYLTIFHILNKEQGIKDIIDILNGLCETYKVKSYDEAEWDDKHMVFVINEQKYILCDYTEGTVVSL